MILEVKELTKLFTKHQGATEDHIRIHSVMTDSRKTAKQSLFVPIVGENFDAHDFLGEAIKQGAVAALWQEDKPLPRLTPTDFPVFFVKDTTKALQQAASYYLKKVDPIVVGITGSNGKTTTKDLVASVLKTKYRTHKTAGNFNNHIGLPLTVLSMDPSTEAVVLEMGMDRAGEISVLSSLAEPDYAIITNIGESHIENLGSREGIANAKLEITEGLNRDGALIIDGDEALLKDQQAEKWTVSCGFGQHLDYQVTILSLTDESSRFKIGEQVYELPMPGKHNVKNATFVIALAEKLGLSAEEIQQGFRELEMSAMRFEKHEGHNGALIINDAYNASPTSMKAIIEVVSQLTSKSRKVLILGDMFELGEQSETLHESVATAINEKIQAVYTIGNHSNRISEAVAAHSPAIKTRHFTDKQTLGHHVRNELAADTVVLIKASRGMKLEEILKDLVD
ncbi:UDP-N-acetylmuramoyl-tripeptide--D-alanyl-D-alanine ligase [Halobacillus karajensis]|uniref:UDP-N-acetylmuramoyl-tripeptide--D-alanyl-D-alanine ligase n=1 Tax=Halobacillus karajensis TaxID=195088 RepID=A0A024P2L9_9BACI|nr:UDP-N-acetylmuramoyl-tripeptide--D-alanyl-D-alanine ligase [Halobacillus karajensis]CDQ19843.1 UDP-N-acetylmuramoyl-tripeptide--D-alanyl-D-alanine ligase [Halobacillus karajensis]CDQ22303.1 UDP-N-acetylmuramoyl-tripeptide--D-alanyl-D-alanine ligase [Halobacillus karajensis]CDQ28144.1 UDP-N-acetylmuramoyl-tripeptide--D-alanyl-D-alanine ligase [Halobacillus karajensis]SEH71200.1 UDP-N-acetylmuramoyl-tripeptide--D-alanyl-D-alanine ligase [Halobacillus karajensis]